MAYGKATEVPFERSISEIVGLLENAGADQIGQMSSRTGFVIQFTMADRHVRFKVTFPTPEELGDLTGPRQDPKRVEQQWRRQRGRALLLVIKAKLESIESEVENFEEAFLANVVLANGETLYECMREPIAIEYKTGAVQPTLPALPASGRK
jgi:hypothetical protein